MGPHTDDLKDYLNWDDQPEAGDHIFPPIHPTHAMQDNSPAETAGGVAQGQQESPSTPSSDDDDGNNNLPDIYKHPKGPLRVLRGNNKTQGTYRWHYASADNKTIGCNITLRPDRCIAIDSTLDYIHLLTNSRECAACGRHSRVPSKWIRACFDAPLRATRTDSDTDETNSTSEDSDTDPEADVVDGE